MFTELMFVLGKIYLDFSISQYSFKELHFVRFCVLRNNIWQNNMIYGNTMSKNPVDFCSVQFYFYFYYLFMKECCACTALKWCGNSFEIKPQSYFPHTVQVDKIQYFKDYITV